MDKELDLTETLRPGLDILANEIVISLKKRSRFKRNLEIYTPGLVLGRPDLSLLEYELARMEHLHAELGRYTYANQEAFTNVSGVELIIKRSPPESPICNFPTSLGDEVMDFYIGWIRESCRAGTDSNTFGETVTSDVAALMNLIERINLGKYVAEYKFQNDPETFRKSGGDAEKILGLIKNQKREEAVLNLASQLAAHYELDRNQAMNIFQWMIEETKKVEVEYIQRRLKLVST